MELVHYFTIMAALPLSSSFCRFNTSLSQFTVDAAIRRKLPASVVECYCRHRRHGLKVGTKGAAIDDAVSLGDEARRRSENAYSTTSICRGDNRKKRTMHDNDNRG